MKTLSEGVRVNTDHAGPEIPVNSRIVSPFSLRIVNGNAGPATAL